MIHKATFCSNSSSRTVRRSTLGLRCERCGVARRLIFPSKASCAMALLSFSGNMHCRTPCVVFQACSGEQSLAARHGFQFKATYVRSRPTLWYLLRYRQCCQPVDALPNLRLRPPNSVSANRFGKGTTRFCITYQNKINTFTTVHD